MAVATVRLRNEANTSTVLSLTMAYDVQFQVERNDIGGGAFTLMNSDPAVASVEKGSVVQFLLDGTPRLIARVTRVDPVMVSVNDEGVEGTEFVCQGILSDWEFARVRLSDVPQCDLVPTLDERIWNWASGEYNATSVFSTWDLATAIAFQGWNSTFYTGQPAGWTDGAAFFMWASTGTDEDAPDGYCLFKDEFLVGAGKKVLDWAADDLAELYVNGKRVQSVTTATVDSTSIRKKQTYEFETTAGFLTLAWKVTNLPFAAGGGPPGANPASLIASMREGSPEGDVIWRTDASGSAPNNALTMRVLEYPSAPPAHPVGGVIRLAMEQNDIINDDWTLNFTDTLDSNGAEFPRIDDISFRVYDDSGVDVLRAVAETWVDFEVDPGDGKVLNVYVKGTIGSTVPLALVTGPSSAGRADPASVNVEDLSWTVEPPKFTALALRWADGWLELGSGKKWESVRLEQLNDESTATAIGNRLLALNEVEQVSASFSYIPLDESTDLPFSSGGPNLFDTWAIPGPDDHDSTTNQVVQAISVSSDENGTARFDVEVGPQVLDEIEWLERAVKRIGPSSLLGRAAQASATSGKAPQHSAEKIKITSPSVGGTTHCIASAPNAVVKSSTAPCLFVGMVTDLRLIGEDGSGTSTVEVSDGVTTWTLTGTGEPLVDVETGINKTWTKQTMLTVNITAVGHTDLHVFADVADV